jgi:hypothetical protein
VRIDNSGFQACRMQPTMRNWQYTSCEAK